MAGKPERYPGRNPDYEQILRRHAWRGELESLEANRAAKEEARTAEEEARRKKLAEEALAKKTAFIRAKISGIDFDAMAKDEIRAAHQAKKEGRLTTKIPGERSILVKERGFLAALDHFSKGYVAEATASIEGTRFNLTKIDLGEFGKCIRAQVIGGDYSKKIGKHLNVIIFQKRGKKWYDITDEFFE